MHIVDVGLRLIPDVLDCQCDLFATGEHIDFRCAQDVDLFSATEKEMLANGILLSVRDKDTEIRVAVAYHAVGMTTRLGSLGLFDRAASDD